MTKPELSFPTATDVADTAASVAGTVVVGCGRQAREHLIPAALAAGSDGGPEVRGVMDVEREFVEAYVDRYNDDAFLATLRRRGYSIDGDVARRFASQVQVRTDLSELVYACTPTFAITAVPNDLHVPVAVELCNRGVNVLGEKPGAPDAEGRQRMLTAARENGVVLAVDYPFVHQLLPERRHARTQVTGASFVWRRANGIPGDEHFYVDPSTGGVDLDLGGHVCTALLTAVGRMPVRVRAEGSAENGRKQYGPRFAAFDTVRATVDFGDKIVGEVYLSWGDGGPVDEEFTGTVYYTGERSTETRFVPQKGVEYKAALPAFATVTRTPEGTSVVQQRVDYPAAIRATVRDFYDAVQFDRSPLLPLETVFAAEAVVDAIHASALGVGQWESVSF